MMRIVLGLSYSGRAYCGWQRQGFECPTVQATVENALSEIADEDVRVCCSGRTDTGVHAFQQVIHFDSQANRREENWIFGANSKLPQDIVVNWARYTDQSFHARFSARSRTYQYLIYNKPTRPALFHGMVTWERYPLRIKNMEIASQHLIGEHDFSSYRASACQAKTSIRRIYQISIHKFNDWLLISVCANAFLHHMVRNIVGVLLLIGRGKKHVDWTADVLAARNRASGGVTAAPDGLYLSYTHYPEQYAIPRVGSLLDEIIH